MTDIDYDKMWKEIIDLTKAKTTILPNEKSIKMFAEEANISETAAKTILDRYVKELKMNKRFVQQGRARVVVYSPILHKDQ